MGFGEEVKRLRAASGLTQKQLAESSGISQGFLAKVETGARPGIGADVLYKLADALGVTCEHFRPFLGGGAVEQPAAKKRGKKK